MTSVRLVIPGRPVPHERVVPKKGGKPFTSRRTRDFEKLVADLSRAAGRVAGETHVDIHLLIAPPTGDLDNYAKSILDGMVKGGLIDDDRTVKRLVVERSKVAKAAQRAIVLVQSAPNLPAHVHPSAVN